MHFVMYIMVYLLMYLSIDIMHLSFAQTIAIHSLTC